MQAQPVERVLFLPSWYPSPVNSVLGTFVREHARASAQRFDTVVVYPYEADGGDAATAPVQRRHSGVLEVLAPFSVPANRHLFGVAYSRAALSAFKSLGPWKPHVIHVHVGYPAGLAGLLALARWRCPVVYTEQAGPLGEKILASRPARAVVPALARAARMGAPVSQFLEDDMRQAGILPRRSMVLPNTVDVSLFHQSAGPRERRAALKLLAAALLVPAKGLETAIDTLSELRQAGTNAELSIAGDGPLRGELEARAIKQGVNESVHFLGLLSKEDLAGEMQRHDIFLMPSERETFSAVVVEAMASGLPVVATRCGGPEELIEPGTGILVDIGDAPSMAHAVYRIATDPDAFRAGPDVARRRFGLEAVAARLAEIYAACGA